MTKNNGAPTPRGSACLEKATLLLIALQPHTEALVLLVVLEVLLWTA
jgi:hypothetical protein